MRTLIALLMIATLSTCTKFGKNVYVDGRVYNPITGEGIPNIPVRLYRNTLDAKDPLGVGSKTLETTTTDANGYYKVEHLSTPFNKVWIRLNNLDYYPIGWVDFGNQGEAGIKKGKKNHLDYQMVPYGYLKQTIKNTSCFDQTDTLFFKREYQISNISNLSDINVLYEGCIDFNSGYYKFPMGLYVISGYCKKNGVVTNFSDSIYITAGGYHEWVFEY